MYDVPLLTNLPFQDSPYLSPIIREVEKERTEREDLDSLTMRKPEPGSRNH